uniref:prolyl aminopeptidase n=1 Tax=Streptomyces sp. JCM 9888 TaxID=1570103 RepID=A0A0B5H0T9_9ACTN|nr:esterase [Streptomyces sp. JCM 9888]
MSALVAIIVLLAGAGVAPADTVRRPSHTDVRALADPSPCPGQPRFICSTLTVPLDHRGGARGSLRLQVAAARNVTAPKGVLLFFGGGPGQAAVPLMSRLAARMPEVARAYRIVTMDQRGTGRTAIDCPALQAEVGSSDIAVPSTTAVAQCARIVGRYRHYYTTEQSLGDFDLLRRALGARQVVVDGASYGSLSAARYAVAYPDHVSRVVLDSTMPHISTPDVPLYLAGLCAQARVLRDACAGLPACSWDPASDVAWLVRHGYDDIALFDTTVAYEYTDPDYEALIMALHRAREGARKPLDELVEATRQRQAANARDYSAGLHAATFCSDTRFPWGDSAVPPWRRGAALRRAARDIPEERVWPYLPATAVGNGFVDTCRNWPVTRPSPAVRRSLPDVPVLIVSGDRDLSTPLEWARWEARYAPRHQLVVIPGADHSLQLFEPGTEGRRAVTDFLRR